MKGKYLLIDEPEELEGDPETWIPTETEMPHEALLLLAKNHLRFRHVLDPKLARKTGLNKD